MPSRIAGKLKAWLAPHAVVLRTAGTLAGPRPVSLRTVKLLRRLAWGADPLAGVMAGRSRRHPAPRDPWALTPWALGYIEEVVHRERPARVLEFGSGRSTVALAAMMRALHGGEDVRVWSVEQDASFAEATLAGARAAGVASTVQVLVSPLGTRTVRGRSITSYSFEEEDLERAGFPDDFDLVLVDGPAAEDGSRLGTLPSVLHRLRPGARFLLDDALRDGEIAVAEAWASLPGVRVEGMILKGKGMLTGTYEGERRARKEPSTTV